jgi:acetylxylan esterase
MRISSSILALTAAAVIPSSVSAQNDTSINCVEGLYMIVARGSNEPEGEGRLIAIVHTVMGRIRGSDSLGLDYPATIDDPNYFESVAEGGKAMKSAVEEYHEACPEGRMAVLGYSQGAHISMDALCGGGVAGFEDLTPLPLDLVESSSKTEPRSRVVHTGHLGH